MINSLCFFSFFFPFFLCFFFFFLQIPISPCKFNRSLMIIYHVEGLDVYMLTVRSLVMSQQNKLYVSHLIAAKGIYLIIIIYCEKHPV